MQGITDGRQLRELVTAASQALAHLDAEQLEELAHCCRLLNDWGAEGRVDGRTLTLQAHEAAAEMAVLGRVLEATRSNLYVMGRLRAPGSSRMEYCEYAGKASGTWQTAEAGDGDN
jgi:hypothetical protein